MVTLHRYVLIKYRELELAPTKESVFDRVFPQGIEVPLTKSGIGVPSYKVGNRSSLLPKKKTKEPYRVSKSVSAAASPL